MKIVGTKFFIVLSLVGLIQPACFAEHYSISALGSRDYVDGEHAYSGSGSKLGETYYYRDNHGVDYQLRKLGSYYYIDGSNGYSARGSQVGSYMYFDDNKRNHYTVSHMGSYDYVADQKEYRGRGSLLGSYYYYDDNKSIPRLISAIALLARMRRERLEND